MLKKSFRGVNKIIAGTIALGVLLYFSSIPIVENYLPGPYDLPRAVRGTFLFPENQTFDFVPYILPEEKITETNTLEEIVAEVPIAEPMPTAQIFEPTVQISTPTPLVMQSPTPTATQIVPTPFANPTYVRLKDVIASKKAPEEVKLSVWEKTTLGKLIAIDGFIEKYSNYYGLDPLYVAMLLHQESSFSPIALGAEGEIGLGQILPKNESIRRAQAGNKYNRYYNPNYVPTKSPWDPETNILITSIAIRSVLDNPRIKSYDDLYAYYVHGTEGFNRDGTLSIKGADAVSSLNKRYNSLRNVLPLLGYTEKEITKIPDPEIRDLLTININKKDGLETYKSLQELYWNNVQKDLVPRYGHALHIEGYHIFISTLYHIYGINQTSNFNKLNELIKLLNINSDNVDLKNYYNKLFYEIKKPITYIPIVTPPPPTPTEIPISTSTNTPTSTPTSTSTPQPTPTSTPTPNSPTPTSTLTPTFTNIARETYIANPTTFEEITEQPKTNAEIPYNELLLSSFAATGAALSVVVFAYTKSKKNKQ